MLVTASLDGPATCATFTITQPESDWQVTGPTPSEVDLAPGAYTVQVDHFEDGVAYTSDPVVVRVDDAYAVADLALCADLAGTWDCGSDGLLDVEMRGCSATLGDLAAGVRVDAHVLHGKTFTGSVTADGAVVSGLLGNAPLVCARVE